MADRGLKDYRGRGARASRPSPILGRNVAATEVLKCSKTERARRRRLPRARLQVSALRRGRDLFGLFGTPRAASSGTDFSWASNVEGPAVFIILIVGFVIVGAAAAVDLHVPPGALRPPDPVAACDGDPRRPALMRPFKATMIAL